MKFKHICYFLAFILAVTLAGGFFYGMVTKGLEFITQTHSKSEIPAVLVAICRKDYQIEQPIKVKITGKTLIASITIRGLIAPNPDAKINTKKATRLLNRLNRICKFNFTTGYYRNSWIKLTQPAVEEGLNLFGDLSENLWPPEVNISEEAKPIVRKFMMAVRRMCLASSADIDFCTYVLIDPALGKMAYTFSVDDLKRVAASWTSSIDFQMFRQIHSTVLDSKYIGDMLINKLLLLSGLKDKKISWLNMDMKSTAINSEERLYFLEPKKTDSAKDAVSSSSIYILVNTGPDNQGIEGIYEKRELPEKLHQYQDASLWEEDERLEAGLCIGDTIYFLGNVTFTDFFTAQISEMITEIIDFIRKTSEAFSEIYPEKENELNIPELEIKTKFLIAETDTATPTRKTNSTNLRIMQLTLSENIEDENTLEKLLNLIIWVIRNRCRAYKYYDFAGLKIVDENSEEIMVISAEDLFSAEPGENSVLRFLGNLLRNEKEAVPFNKPIVPTLERF